MSALLDSLCFFVGLRRSVTARQRHGQGRIVATASVPVRLMRSSVAPTACELCNKLHSARQAGRPGWRSSSLDGALPKGSQATTLVAAGRHPSTMPTSALRHPHDRCVVSTATWRRFSWRHKTNRNLGLGPGGHPYSARHEQGAWEQIRFGPVPVPSLNSQPGFQPCPPTPLSTEESNVHPCCRASSSQSHRAAANCCLFPPPCWAHPVSLPSLPGHPGSMLLS